MKIRSLDLALIFSDGETWESFGGAHVCAFPITRGKGIADEANELPKVAALVYNLADPTHLRNLADLIELGGI